MRLDKFLFAARIFKSRTLAGEAISSSMVFVDSVPAKASRAVKAGTIIEINTMNFYKKIEILKIPAGNILKNEASSFYNTIDERDKT